MDYKIARNEIGKGNISPIYVCCGSEKYFRQEFISYLLDQCLESEHKDFAISKYDLAETPVDTVIEDAETLPFMVPRKIVLAHNALFFTGAKESSKVEHNMERLQAYIQSPVDYAVIVFTVDAEKLDERKKIVKELKARGAVIVFPPLNAEELMGWVLRQATHKQFTFAQGAAERLILNTGADVQKLAAELEKLEMFIGPGGQVLEEQVEKLVVRDTEQSVFLLIDEIVHMRMERAFSILDDLIKQREEPIKILALLARQFRIILQVKELHRQGLSQRDMASRVGVHPYGVRLASEQARKYEMEKLYHILAQLSELDFQMKSGGMDKLLGLEMFLLKLAV